MRIFLSRFIAAGAAISLSACAPSDRATNNDQAADQDLIVHLRGDEVPVVETQRAFQAAHPDIMSSPNFCPMFDTSCIVLYDQSNGDGGGSPGEHSILFEGAGTAALADYCRIVLPGHPCATWDASVESFYTNYVGDGYFTKFNTRLSVGCSENFSANDYDAYPDSCVLNADEVSLNED